ncbi:PHP domain-containing protein [Candidatus Omnitrophota bacterium]
MKCADLHIHTNFSDSTSLPDDVVKRAVAAGLDAISITDHDTVEGVLPVIKAAQNTGLEIIPGIEMTSEIDEREIHLLGYFVDIENAAFLKKLGELQELRVKRIYTMVEKLTELGIDNLEAEEVLEFAGKGAVGRVHLAMMLQQKGWVYSVPEAFYKYIGEKCPAYVSKFKLTPSEVIEAIRSAGGVAVLAHPHVCPEPEGFVSSLTDAGLKGLEIYYPSYSKNLTHSYKQLAEKYNLLVTGGSDDHGLAKEQARIGRIKIPYSLVEALKQEKCQSTNTS